MNNQNEEALRSSSSSGHIPSTTYIETDPNNDLVIAGSELRAAVASGDCKRVACLCGTPGLDPNIWTINGVPLLHYAIINHNEKMIKNLYNFKRQEKNIKDGQGQTALELAEITWKESKGLDEAAAAEVRDYIGWQVRNAKRVEMQYRKF